MGLPLLVFVIFTSFGCQTQKQDSNLQKTSRKVPLKFQIKTAGIEGLPTSLDFVKKYCFKIENCVSSNPSTYCGPTTFSPQLLVGETGCRISLKSFLLTSPDVEISVEEEKSEKLVRGETVEITKDITRNSTKLRHHFLIEPTKLLESIISENPQVTYSLTVSQENEEIVLSTPDPIAPLVESYCSKAHHLTEKGDVINKDLMETTPPNPLQEGKYKQLTIQGSILEPIKTEYWHKLVNNKTLRVDRLILSKLMFEDQDLNIFESLKSWCIKDLILENVVHMNMHGLVNFTELKNLDFQKTSIYDFHNLPSKEKVIITNSGRIGVPDLPKIESGNLECYRDIDQFYKNNLGQRAIKCLENQCLFNKGLIDACTDPTAETITTKLSFFGNTKSSPCPSYQTAITELNINWKTDLSWHDIIKSNCNKALVCVLEKGECQNLSSCSQIKEPRKCSFSSFKKHDGSKIFCKWVTNICTEMSL